MAIYIKSLLIQFKRKPILSIFMLVCFIVSALTVSLISSMINEETKKVKELNLGYNKDQIVPFILKLKSGKEVGKYEDVKAAFDNLNDKYMIKLQKDTELKKKKIHPDIFYDKDKVDININMYSGRIISANTPYEVVIGKALNDRLENPKTITLFNEQLKVVGICDGYNKDRVLLHGNSIDRYFMGNDEFSKEVFFVSFIKKNDKINDEDKKIIESELKKINNLEKCQIFSSNTTFSGNLGRALHNKKQDVKLKSLLILIAICNIMVASTFWIMDRKKEIAIRKAFGAEKKHIISLVYKELGSLMFLALIISVIIQYGFSKVLTGFLGSTLTISFINLVILILMEFMVTVISSIVPIYRALKIEISQCLKE